MTNDTEMTFLNIALTFTGGSYSLLSIRPIIRGFLGLAGSGAELQAETLLGLDFKLRHHRKVERSQEVVALFKTRASLADALAAAVKELHSYTTPAIVTLPMEGGDPAYLGWIMAETTAATG